MLGHLGYITGVRSVDVVLVRDGIGEADQNLDNVPQSQSEIFRAPEEVFLFLMEQIHRAEPGEDFEGKIGCTLPELPDSVEKINFEQMAEEILRGADVQEMVRFGHLVMATEVQIYRLFDVYLKNEGVVDETIGELRGMLGTVVLSDKASVQNHRLLQTEEGFLNGLSETEKETHGQLNFDWIVVRIARFCHAIQQKICEMASMNV
jgi:hypothetical protein